MKASQPFCAVDTVKNANMMKVTHSAQAAKSKQTLQLDTRLLHEYRPQVELFYKWEQRDSFSPHETIPSPVSFLSAFWLCTCYWFLLLHSTSPRRLIWGFESSATEINGDVMATVMVTMNLFLKEVLTAFLAPSADQLSLGTQRIMLAGHVFSHPRFLTYLPFPLH